MIILETSVNTAIGIPNTIKPGEYCITVLFSGDNFKSKKIKFHIKKPNNNSQNEVKMNIL